MEWFDFGLFVFLAPLIGAKFFASHDSNSATLAALGVFASGFIARPLGAILFGHWGDRAGRSQTLRYSILLITLTTIFIGLLPSYETMGINASILFVALRVIQGLSIGGEYGGVMIYLAESAPANRRGFMTSFAATGANAGFLLATIVVMILKFSLTETQLQSWGWRLPFIFIGIIGCIVFYSRFQLTETSIYLQLKDQNRLQKKPLLTALRLAPKQLLKILGLTSMSATFYCVFFGCMPIYLSTHLGLNSIHAFTIQTIFLTLMLCLVPIAGICGDYLGRKHILLITAGSIIILTVPCFYLLNIGSTYPTIFALSIATLLSSFDQGNTSTAVVEACPADIRYSGVSLSYNIGNALFGGTAPLVVYILTQFNYLAPAYYLIGMAMISLLTILTLTNSYSA